MGSSGDDDALAATIGGAAPVEATYQVGDRIGDRYRVAAFLGKGGMGAVFLVHDDALGGPTCGAMRRAGRRTAGRSS